MRLKRTRRQFRARDDTRNDGEQSRHNRMLSKQGNSSCTSFHEERKGKRRNDEEARSGSRKKGIVPEKDGKTRRVERSEEGMNEEGTR